MIGDCDWGLGLEIWGLGIWIGDYDLGFGFGDWDWLLEIRNGYWKLGLDIGI